MNATLIDIETVHDIPSIDVAEGSYGAYIDNLKIKQDTVDPWVPWWYHKPVVLAGVALKGSRVHSFCYREDDKDSIAKKWWMALSISPVAPTVTWNGRGFDLPILELAAVREGLDVSGWMKLPVATLRSYENPRGRYSGRHFDLQEIFSNDGATTRPGQNAIAAVLGLPGKLGVDGSDVAALYEAGKLDEIAGYCACDVMTLLAIWLQVQKSLRTQKIRTAQELYEAANGFAAIGYGDAMDKWRKAG